MPFKVSIFLILVYFAILPVSKSVAGSKFYTDSSAQWTTTGTSTTTSSMTVESASMDSSANSTIQTPELSSPSPGAQSNQSTGTQSYQSARYGYDEFDRLKWVQYEDGTKIIYEFDKTGNRTAKTTTNSLVTGNPTLLVTSIGNGLVLPSGNIIVPSGGQQSFHIEPAGFNDSRCKSVSPGFCPDPDYGFNSQLNRCERGVGCSQGTFSSVTDRCETPKENTTGYSPAISRTQITKYFIRGTTATSVADYLTEMPIGQDYVSFTFAVDNGQAVLLDQCASGPRGSCAFENICSKPRWVDNWTELCTDGLNVTQTRSGDVLTASISAYQNRYAGMRCREGFTYEYDDDDPDSVPTCVKRYWDTCDVCIAACMDDYNDCVAPNDPSCIIHTPCEQVLYEDPIPTYDQYILTGATAMAEPSEIICPSGYRLTAPLNAATCAAIVANWGNATGITDCSDPGKYVCSGPATACRSSQTPSVTGNCAIASATPQCPNGFLDPATHLCAQCVPDRLVDVQLDGISVMNEMYDNLGSLQQLTGPSGPFYFYYLNNITADHAVTVTFSNNAAGLCSYPPARLARAPQLRYLSLQAAYNAAANNDTVQGTIYDHLEDLLLDRNVAVSLEGGYSCDYASISGNLTIKGGMTITDGTVTVKGNVILAGP